MISRSPYSLVHIGDGPAINLPLSFQHRLGMCSNSSLRVRSAVNQGGQLITSDVFSSNVIRSELQSDTSDEFNSKDFLEMQTLAQTVDSRVCVPPILDAPPGPPHYGSSSYVSISPMTRPTRVTKPAKANAGRLLLSPIQPNFGSQVYSWTTLCAPSPPGQMFPEEVSSSSISRNLFHPSQLGSYRQVSATASDYHTSSSQKIIIGASIATQSRGKDLKKMMKVSSLLTDAMPFPNQPSPHTAVNPTRRKCDADDDWVPKPKSAPKTKKTGIKHPIVKIEFNDLKLVTPTELDVLSGRGGETNKHEGNIMFRKEACKLRASYRAEDTSRDEKYVLSLVG